jgi:hypothetical protein
VGGPFFADELEPAPARYPERPGHKRRDTSKAAADGIAPQAKTLREQVYDAIKARPGTPEEIARRTGIPLMNVRPRCSELVKKNLVIDTGQRRQASGGRMAIVWRAV